MDRLTIQIGSHTWTDEQFVLDHQIQPWTEMPLWIPEQIDVPEGRADFMSYLERAGFVKTNMKNSAAMPQRNNSLYAIASQAFG